jgi:hypothetical protein
MNIGLFNEDYTVRRFGREARNIRGKIVYDYTDITVSMHVHPLNYSQVWALPAGERRTNRIAAECSEKLYTSDQDKGIKADLLWYDGQWYECVSEAVHKDTILAHGNYQFVVVPTDAGGTTDTKPPLSGN